MYPSFLGVAIAERLVKELPTDTRITLVITSRTLPGVKDAARKIKEKTSAIKREGLVEFDYVIFDQCNMVSMLSAAYELKKRYSHLDYLFLNSSYAQFIGIDYWQALKDLFHEPLKSFTVGTFKLQGSGKKTDDGMGAVFQANVVSPWYLINELIPLLSNGGRLIWISSSISVPEYLEFDDLEMIKNNKAYETSKYEIEMLQHVTHKPLLETHGIQSWLLQPGVFKSTSFVPNLNFFAYLGMLLMFYLCRFCGSPYHCIWPEVAANAPVWTALHADPEKDDMTIKYGSGTDRWGNEILMKTPSNPPRSEELYNYVETRRKEYVEKFKNQVIERYLY